MPCYSPAGGYVARSPSADGKRAVLFGGKVVADGEANMSAEWDARYQRVQFPCGSCTGCLLERSRQWAVRCTHEASLYDENCFVTLTYADEHLPANGGLWPEDWDVFIKALRQKVRPRRIRYFMCGEYGERFGRPHFHGLLFGWWPPDAEALGVRKGLPVWRSQMVEETWKRGRVEIGTVTFESAAYVARYVLKKRGTDGRSVGSGGTGVESGDDALPPRRGEYARMSRRPGIGYGWITEYAGEVVAADSVVVRGVECKPPRYYDVVCSRFAEEAVEANKAARGSDGDPRRRLMEGRRAAGVIAEQRVNLYRRELEE